MKQQQQKLVRSTKISTTMSSTKTYSASTKNKIETSTTTNSATTTYSACSKIKSETAN